MANKSSTFQVFRYQILPIDRYEQPGLFGREYGVDDLLEKKNDFFAEALSQQQDFSSEKHETPAQLLRKENDLFVFQVGHNKKINRETRDFRNEEIDNWPSTKVIVWNHPEKQYILVQKRTSAFSSCETVVKLILAKVNRYLGLKNLRVIHEPLFEKRSFWEKIEEIRGKIEAVKFEIITPNMANISGSLSEDIKRFAKATNSTRNELKIEAEPESSLVLERGDETLEGLVDYSSMGGGNISIKIRGIKAKFHTSKKVKEIYMDEVELSGNSASIKSLIDKKTDD